jgi:hypothetical protein
MAPLSLTTLDLQGIRPETAGRIADSAADRKKLPERAESVGPWLT